MITESPWGVVQQAKVVTEGITFVSTASHGGFKLSDEMQAKMPDYLRRDGGWYEEDCDYARVIVCFPQHFSAEEQDRAMASLRNWAPDAWERYFGRTIPEGQSFIKDQRLFYERHKDDYVAVAAWGSWHANVPDGMVCVCATKGGVRNGRNRDKDKYFLVPESEYDYDFIVNTQKHKEVGAAFLNTVTKR